jgi:uncharacterized RDD family membrane protein YckC
MSSAAQREEASESYRSTGTEGGVALKQLAAERLAAHRNRRAVVEGREAQDRREQAEAQAATRLQARREAARAEGHPDASRVRDAVAARYQQSLSYREFLAAESQRALDKAHAEAEVATRNAKAMAAAQRELLDEIAQWNQAEPAVHTDAEEFFSGTAVSEELLLLEMVEPREDGAATSAAVIAEGQRKASESQRASTEVQRARKATRDEASFDFAPAPLPAASSPPAPLQVRLHGEMDLALPTDTFYAPSPRVSARAEELAELDDEIEFRSAPEFEDLVLETQSIPGNIIEFPRQLVASRKARPRLAEGPLRADGTPEPQLRIFEVEPAQISLEPETPGLSNAPEWQGLLLGAGSPAEASASVTPQLETQLQLDQELFAAPLQRRILSAAVDAVFIAAGLAAFSAVAIKIAGQALRSAPRPLLGGAAAGTLVIFALLYQLLFCTLNEATPGMRATRIAYCTFSEKNPTRRALRRRVVATALAACPLGLGLVWMALDSDRLGWHDRISHIYPRSY